MNSQHDPRKRKAITSFIFGLLGITLLSWALKTNVINGNGIIIPFGISLVLNLMSLTLGFKSRNSTSCKWYARTGIVISLIPLAILVLVALSILLKIIVGY